MASAGRNANYGGLFGLRDNKLYYTTLAEFACKHKESWATETIPDDERLDEMLRDHCESKSGEAGREKMQKAFANQMTPHKDKPVDTYLRGLGYTVRKKAARTTEEEGEDSEISQKILGVLFPDRPHPNNIVQTALQSITPVSYTHLTLPTKRIV